MVTPLGDAQMFGLPHEKTLLDMGALKIKDRKINAEISGEKSDSKRGHMLY